MTRVIRPLIVEEFTRLEALPPEPPDPPDPPTPPAPPDLPPSTGVLREATPDDIPAIVRMGLACFAGDAYAGRLQPDPVHLAWEARRLLTMGRVYLAVDADAGPVGMCGAVIVPSLQHGRAIAVSTMWWVEPGVRARGLGRRLLDCTVAWATWEHATAFHLVVPAGDTAMAAMAERAGFVWLESIWQQLLPAGGV